MATDELTALLYAEAQIRRTLAEYGQACDDGRFADFGRCFTEDAVLEVSGRQVRGRAAIEAWVAAAMPPGRRGKHVTVNSVVTVAGEDASARSDYLFLAPGEESPRVSVAGRYDDELRRVDGRWLIARRAIGFLPPPA